MRCRLAHQLFAAAPALALLACGEPGPPPRDNLMPQLPPLTQFTTHPAFERDAAWSPDGQWVSFGSVRSGNEDIWKQRADGTGQAVQITAESSNEIYAVWSPDGTRLAFTSDKGGTGNVWTIGADGGEMTRVTADSDSVSLALSGGSMVSWSPDGEWIAFMSTRGGTSDIWAVSVDGEGRRLVAGGPAAEETPSWSPDGRWIAFTSNRSGDWDLWAVGADGGQPRQVTTGPASDWTPSWSPDGRWLAFQSDRSGYTHIWAVPSAGGTPVQVSGRPEVNDYVARFSPDGTRISFNSAAAGGALSVVPAEGGPVERLGASGLSGMGAWSPDGTEIAFIGTAVASVEGGRDLYIAARSGTWMRPVTAGGQVDQAAGFYLANLDWSPAGDEIVFTRGEGTRDLWAVSADGGEAWQVTAGPGNEIQARYSPDGKRLAYAGNSGATASDWDIWVVPAAGGIAERLLDWPSIEWGPCWSPDGERLAFVSNRARDGQATGPWQVWTVSATGAEPQWLAEGQMPSWSPEGAQITFAEAIGALLGPRIWRVAATGGTPELLVESGGDKAWPRWSPDGREILFGEFGAGVADIWIAELGDLLKRM